jgi:hypothetical protein
MSQKRIQPNVNTPTTQKPTEFEEVKGVDKTNSILADIDNALEEEEEFELEISEEGAEKLRKLFSEYEEQEDEQEQDNDDDTWSICGCG